jgi:hypothetical protein
MARESENSENKLDDVLGHGFRVVFCGMAASTVSAEKGQYYAGPGNKFWKTLYEIGLTERELDPAEYRTLPARGRGKGAGRQESAWANCVRHGEGTWGKGIGVRRTIRAWPKPPAVGAGLVPARPSEVLRVLSLGDARVAPTNGGDSCR